MANADDRDTTPQEAQKNGQSAISQDTPLRELRQDGDARGDRAAKSPSNATPELSDKRFRFCVTSAETAGPNRPTSQ